MKSTLIISALVVLLLVPQQAPGQEPLKLIYSQFTMTNSATWFAREAGLFETRTQLLWTPRRRGRR